MKLNIRILLILNLLWLSSACNVYRVVPKGKYLLRKNKVKYQRKDIIKPSEVRTYILQQPNFYILGYPVLVGIYSIADPHPQLTFNQSIAKHPKTYKFFEKIFSKKQAYFQLKRYYININRQIRQFGEAPVVIDSNLTAKSQKNLHLLFKNYGFIDNQTSFQINPVSPIKAHVIYLVREKEPYRINTVQWQINAPYLSNQFQQIKHQLKTRQGQIYNRNHLAHDREFLTHYFRNKGVYDFQSSYITYDIIKRDSLHLLDIHGLILNKITQLADSIVEKPFIPYRYEKINVYITPDKKIDSIKRPGKIKIADSLRFYFVNHRYYRPDLLSEAIQLRPGALYSDKNVLLTRKQLYYLNNFKQIYVTHRVLNDSTLSSNILLTPLKKFSLKSSFNITHSSIRPLGLSVEISNTWRNVFYGFENLQLSFMFNQAASKKFTAIEGNLFNVREMAADLSLNIPRFILPYFRRFVPLFMEPKTIYSLRYTTQTNIGLDREKFYAINTYEWKPSHPVRNELTPVEINYVHYKNPERYFQIYTTAFNTLNQISQDYYNTTITPGQADDFIRFVLLNEPSNSSVYQEVKRIYERKVRLTENIFIINSHHTITYDTRKDIWDNHFYMFRFYGEIAGWLPGLFSEFIKLPENAVGQKMINKIPYAQYFKGEFTFIRHWDFGKKRILAYRFFSGIGIPFGNSTNIPFVSAYFAGGSNDIRAWRAFELGPGSTGGLGEFNEANFKLLTNLEYRMPFYENHHLGFFIDAGNIWNIFDDVPYRKAQFKGVYSLLHEIAIGGGIGYRYDFSIFAIRLDLAFKFFDPARPEGDRWVRNNSINQAVLQFGINYPF